VLKPRTIVAEALGRVAEPYRDIIPPLHPATTYERAPDGSYPGGRKYSRDENPTYDAPEALLAALEGGEQALLFGSGLAAATAVFQALRPGDTVLVPRRMYWALRKWLLGPATEWGLRVELYENGDIDHLDSLATRHRPALVWVETPANPTWDIQDLRATADAAHRHGAIVAADSTVATPVLTRPLELGADLVMHSATKYLNGHSDVVAGALVTRAHNELWQRIRDARAFGGAVLGPFEAWLLLRGMRTLVLRVEAACATALAIAEAIDGHPALSRVLYPGLPSHAGHRVAREQMRGGYGAMLSVRLAGGEAAARAFIAGLKLFKQATSLGSVESLVEHRASVEGEGTLCPPDLVRLSIGIEDPGDLIDDITRALNAL
jgi:cystathionine gamma-synthase